jgi:PAS domain S-box-containing protein
LKDELHESEERFRLLVDSVSDYAIFLLDPDGKVSSWNTGAERIKGYRAEEIVGRPFTVFYPPEALRTDHPAWELRMAMRDGRYQEEGWRVRKDGSLFWAHVTITALRDSAGRLKGFSKVTRDLSERKRAEKTIEEEQARFRLLVESVKDYAIFMLDPQGRVTSWNAGARRLKGYEPEEIIGQHFSRFYGPEDRAANKPAHMLEWALREGVAHEEGWRIRKDGSRFWANVTITTLLKDGEVKGFAKVTQDLTARREQELALRDANMSLERRVQERTAELQALNDELESFSYSVSHDLRSPLRAMEGFSKVLLEDYARVLDDRGRHYLERVRSGSQRMAILIDDLLKLSRVTRGEFHQGPVDLAEIAREVLEELKRRAPERTVTLSIAPSAPASGDPRLLRVALENLLGNAWKFTGRKADARIEFGTQKRDGESLFFVRDNGAGFDMAYADKLFAPFQRFHDDDEFEGTGIGLATVQRIIRRHGGRIWAESEPGRGAAFWFTLRSA